jgi:hypothetical protein
MAVITRSQTRRVFKPVAAADQANRHATPTIISAPRKRGKTKFKAGDGVHLYKRRRHSGPKSSSAGSALTPGLKRIDQDEQHPLLKRTRQSGTGGDRHSPTGAALLQSKPVVSTHLPSPFQGPKPFACVGRFLSSGAPAPSPTTMAHQEEQARRQAVNAATPAWRRCAEEEPGEWRPRPVVGQSLGDNLSALEEAERMVKSMEAVYQHARQKVDPEHLYGVAAELLELTKWRDELKATGAPEDMTP